MSWTYDNDTGGRWMVFDDSLPDDAPVVCREIREEAHAILIAVAPEMLAALKAAEAVLERRAMSQADRDALALVSAVVGKLKQDA